MLRLLQARAGALRAAGGSGPEGSLGKLATSVVGRRLAEFAPSLLGPEALLIDGYDNVAVDDATRRTARRPVRDHAVVRRESRASRSPAAPTRSSATSSVIACSGCRASRASTGAFPGARRNATESTHTTRQLWGDDDEQAARGNPGGRGGDVGIRPVGRRHPGRLGSRGDQDRGAHRRSRSAVSCRAGWGRPTASPTRGSLQPRQARSSRST